MRRRTIVAAIALTLAREGAAVVVSARSRDKLDSLAGEIEALGPGVAGRRVGEPVIVGAQHGCYAERVAVPAHQALPAIPDFTLHENAATRISMRPATAVASTAFATRLVRI